MLLNKWWARLTLALLVFATVLACRTSDVFIAQQPTNTPTRTPRPTFTPLPKSTDTPVPTVPPPPPPTAVPTTAPTKKPTPRPPTPKPPTAVPPPVVQPTSPPPAPKFPYAANPATCVHAGNQYIKGKVYDSSDPSANGVPGLKVAMGGADGSNPYVTIKNEDDGFYTFTLTTAGSGAQAGTYYIWLMDGNGNRISDVGGPIKMNPVGPDAAGTCWAGSVDFWKR